MIASPIAESGPWSLGTLIGLPVGIVLVITLAGVGVWLIRKGLAVKPGAYADERHMLLTFGGCTLAFGLAAAALTAAPGTGMYPYDSEYHQWRDVTGTVERVDSRQIADGEGMSERYVFVIEGQPFGVDDTRAAVVNEGDTVSLRCKREWQYASESGWGCRWAGKS